MHNLLTIKMRIKFLQVPLKTEVPKKYMFSKRLGQYMAASPGNKSQNTKVYNTFDIKIFTS